MTNESRTLSRTPGTPVFQSQRLDWAWYVAREQRQLLARVVGKRDPLPNPEELAVVIRKHLAPKRAVIYELMEAAEAVAKRIPDARLTAALEAARRHFG